MWKLWIWKNIQDIIQAFDIGGYQKILSFLEAEKVK